MSKNSMTHVFTCCESWWNLCWRAGLEVISEKWGISYRVQQWARVQPLAQRPRIEKFYSIFSITANHGPFWSVRVQIDPSWALLVSLSPNWPIKGRFGQFGSKLTNHGPFWSVWVQIGQITVRFGQLGSELANHGPFWSVRVQVG